MIVQDPAIGAFERFITAGDFPCVGARSARATGNMRVVRADDLTKPADTCVLTSLQNFAAEAPTQLASVVALFPETPALSECAFEAAMWQQLAVLVEADRRCFAPDPSISSDPTSPDFAISLGGKGFFVVGMHPGASRLARRAPVTALVFNRHDQFRDLKASGQYDRMREVVRRRDIALQGDINPMLADHGEHSEAIQYSGRAVSGTWVCPFKAHRDAA